jgi:hypothetical protein
MAPLAAFVCPRVADREAMNVGRVALGVLGLITLKATSALASKGDGTPRERRSTGSKKQRERHRTERIDRVRRERSEGGNRRPDEGWRTDPNDGHHYNLNW